MPFTLFSRILPPEIAIIIFNFIKLKKTQIIYWEQLYSPASFIVKKLVKRYSDYNKVFYPISDVYNELMIITRITNKFAVRGLIQKNIYIYMDEYIDNLHTLKKHMEFHFEDKRQESYGVKPLFICDQSMIQSLDKFID